MSNICLYLIIVSLSAGQRGTAGRFPRRSHFSRNIWSLQCSLDLSCGLIPHGCSLSLSPGRCPGGILVRWLNHLGSFINQLSLFIFFLLHSLCFPYQNKNEDFQSTWTLSLNISAEMFWTWVNQCVSQMYSVVKIIHNCNCYDHDCETSNNHF